MARSRTAAPAAEPGKLSPFEGKDVLRAAIEIPNAAGALREAMKFEPVELHHGAKVYVVLECDVAKVRFDPVKDTDALARVHVFDAIGATMVDADLVRSHLDAQRERIQLAKEEAEGVQRVPFDGDEE